MTFEGAVNVFSEASGHEQPVKVSAGEYLQFDAAGRIQGTVLPTPERVKAKLARTVPGVDGLENDATYDELLAALVAAYGSATGAMHRALEKLQ